MLAVLCQPAPWLPPPPVHILPALSEDHTKSAEKSRLAPEYYDEISDIHPAQVLGLDISSDDLDFAVQGTAPPPSEVELEKGGSHISAGFFSINPRWEDLDVKIWRGGLEVINETFVDVECIVSSEVYAFVSSFRQKNTNCELL